MSTRIYVVTDLRADGSEVRLIRAGNQAQAIKYAAQTLFDIEVAGQDDLVNLLTNGVPIELATSQATADIFEDVITNAGGTD